MQRMVDGIPTGIAEENRFDRARSEVHVDRNFGVELERERSDAETKRRDSATEPALLSALRFDFLQPLFANGCRQRVRMLREVAEVDRLEIRSAIDGKQRQ